MHDVKVTVQEKVLYGVNAGLVRKLGDAVTATDAATAEVCRLLEESRLADDATPETRKQDDAWVNGDSPHTQWLDGVYERVWATNRDAQKALLAIADQALERERTQREQIDSMRVTGSPAFQMGEPTST